MTHMWQLAFDGSKSREGTMTISEAAVFQRLDQGTPVYGMYINKI